MLRRVWRYVDRRLYGFLRLGIMINGEGFGFAFPLSSLAGSLFCPWICWTVSLFLFGTKVAFLSSPNRIDRGGLVGHVGLAAWLWFSRGLKAASSALALAFPSFSPPARLKSPTWNSFENKNIMVLQLPESFFIVYWAKALFAFFIFYSESCFSFVISLLKDTEDTSRSRWPSERSLRMMKSNVNMLSDSGKACECSCFLPFTNL